MIIETLSCCRGFPYRLASNFMLGVIFSPEACFGGRLAVARMSTFHDEYPESSIKHPESVNQIDQSMQNKPNFMKNRMNVTYDKSKRYENAPPVFGPKIPNPICLEIRCAHVLA